MLVSRFRWPLTVLASCAIFVLTASAVAAQTATTTPVGNTTVTLTDPLFTDGEARWFGSPQPITLTFSSVTVEGSTWLESRADLTPPPPAGMQAGSPPFYYDIQSTAAFDGPVTVCFDLRGTSFGRPESELQIYTAAVNTWTPLANQNASSSDRLCGDAVALGTFAIFYQQVPATAIATFAGTGVAAGALDGPGGDPRDDLIDNVPATQSALTQPSRLAHDAAGNIYVMEVTTRIRRIDPSGVITTIVSTGVCAESWPIAVDSAGQTLYCVQWSQTRPGLMDIVRVDLGGASHAIFVAELPEVLAMVVHANGDVFYSEGSTGSIHRVAAGTQNSQLLFRYDNTLAPLTLPGWERIHTLAFDAENHLLAGGFTLIRIAPGANGHVDGSADETVARIAGVGASLVSSYSQPFAGDGLPASQALLMLIHQMIVAADGAVVFADYNGLVRRIDPGVDGIVNGGADETVRGVAGYYHPTWYLWQGIASGFATSQHLQLIRGVIEDPRSPGAFIIASALGHQLLRIGRPAGDDPPPSSGADISVNVIGAPDTLDTGAVLTYTAVVRNRGRLAARATLTMPVSATDVSSVSASSTAGFCTVPVLLLVTSGNVVCDAGLITPGGEVVVTIQVTPTKPGTLSATFTVTSDQDDAVPANNTATVTTSVLDRLPPSAIISAPTTVALGANLTASAQGSTDLGGGRIVRYRWLLAERNQIVETTMPEATFAADAASPLPVGRYEIVLTVFDDGGNASAPASAMVDIVELAPANDAYTVSQGGTLASTVGAVAEYPVQLPSTLPRPKSLTDFNGSLVFIDGRGRLSRSDGTTGGLTVLAPRGGEPTVAAGVLFFVGADSSHGAELWKSDGTPGGTALVKDIVAGAGSSLPYELTDVGGTLFFVVDGIDPSSDWDDSELMRTSELWRSDGTTAGTSLVKAFSWQGTSELFLRNAGGMLYFRVLTGGDRGLWKSDGTHEGTVRVQDIQVEGTAVARGSGFIRNWYPDTPVAVGNNLFFLGRDAGGTTLWRATANGANVFVPTIATDDRRRLVVDFAEANGRLYFGVFNVEFSHSNGTSSFFRIAREMWSSDGTPEGTSLLKAFDPVLRAGFDAYVFEEEPFFFRESGDYVYFRHSGLWRTDGTAAGTMQVTDVTIFWPSRADLFAGFSSLSMSDVDGTLYFDGQRGPQMGVWKTDGTPAGTVLVTPTPSGYSAFDITNVGDLVYFTRCDDPSTGYELWVIGGAPGVLGNDVVRPPRPVTATLLQPPAHGTVGFRADGTFTYRPDAAFAGTDQFTYTLTSADGTITSAPATVTIEVTPRPSWVSVTDASIAEGNAATTNLVFTVTRNGGLSQTAAMTFDIGGGSATAGVDYQAASGRLTFAPGETTQQIIVPVNGDTADEPDEIFLLTLNDAVNTTIARTRAFGRIVGDDFHADLQVVATATPDPVLIGEPLTYDVVITNNGPRAATAISMTMPVDRAAISAVSATSPAGVCVVPAIFIGGSSPVTCDGGSLAPGGSLAIAVSVTPRTPGGIASTFTVSGELSDPVSGNNAPTVLTSVTAPPHYAYRSGVRYPAADASGSLTPVFVEFTALSEPGLVLANAIPGPPPPAEFAVVSQTFDITTTASVTGPITVCISGAALTPADRLFHFAAARWADITIAALSTPAQICGQSLTLSPFAIMRDVTAPAVTMASPAAAASHVLGEVVNAQYACTDNGSGVASCGGPVASSQPIDTASVGAKTFTVTATDVAGNMATVTASYRVSYRVCLLYEPLKVKRSGSTVPIALRLCDATGQNRSSASTTLAARGVRLIAGGDMGPAEDAGNANPDTAFRYDAALAGYIFNLKTTGYSPGLYGLTFTVGDDPTIRVAEFRVQ